MSSLPVAAQQRRASPRLPLGLVALVVALAIGAGAFIGGMAVVNRAGAAPAPSVATAPIKHHSAVPPAANAAAAQLAGYRNVVADLAAAVKRHDFAQQYLLGRQLDAKLTPAVIGLVYQEHARLAASLETAAEHHDTHARALISRQLASICGPAAVKSRLAFCN
jgi:hypothetical protein